MKLFFLVFLQRRIEELTTTIAQQNETIARLYETVAQRDETVAQRDETIAQRDETIVLMGREIQDLKGTIIVLVRVRPTQNKANHLQIQNGNRIILTETKKDYKGDLKDYDSLLIFKRSTVRLQQRPTCFPS